MESSEANATEHWRHRALDHKEASCVARMIHVQVFLEVRHSAACLRGRSGPEDGIVYTQKRRKVIMVGGVVNAVTNRVSGEH